MSDDHSPAGRDQRGAPRAARVTSDAPVQPVQPVQPADTPQPQAEMPRELGGPKGPEPTRYGDWERNGRCSDF